MNNMNVIIADDHPIVLFGIRKSLEQIEWVNVVGEFEDSTALINNLPKLDAHVLITDLSMPGDKYGDGITLIKYIKRHFPSLSIIVLTMNNNPAILSAVLDLDIEGIVLKQGAPTDLPKALAALQKGKKFTPESVSRLFQGASCSISLSIFSLKSNTTAIEIINAMANTYVPKNFLMIYQSSRFINRLLFILYNLVDTLFTIIGFQVEKSPAMICFRASPTSHR